MTGISPRERTDDLAPAPAAATHPNRGANRQIGLVRGLVAAMRPRQWLKNLLVVAAPLAAGTLLEPGTLRATGLAFCAFCLAASGIYLVNDVCDVTTDRAHPRKRYRPIAAGIVPAGLAVGIGTLLLVAAMAAAAILGSVALFVVIAVYIVMSLAYCLWLKHQAVFDLAVVSSGFLLRAMAGGAAAGLPLSQWFLLVAAFGALFVVAGKRYAELQIEGVTPVSIRRALDGYSDSYLRFVWGVSAGIAVTAYSLWAFELRETSGSILPAISIAAFVLGVLRYAVDIDRGQAGEPEDTVLKDRVLLVIGLVWLVLVAIGAWGA